MLDENLPIVRALGAAQVAVTGAKTAPIIRRPGADAVHLTVYGVPCVAFGPGGRMHPDARGVSMHAFGEHVLIDDCVDAARIYRRRRSTCAAEPSSDTALAGAAQHP